LIRNKNLIASGLADLPIPEFYPALCLLDDADHEKAVHLIRENLAADPACTTADQVCEACGEPIPGSFGLCWNCEAPFTAI
jgi:hypothetical protein